MSCLSNVCWYLSSRKRGATVALIAVSIFCFVASWEEKIVMENLGEVVTEISESFEHDKYELIDKDDFSWLQQPEDFFLRLANEKPRTICRKLVRFGGMSCEGKSDGDKFVCLDPDVAPPPRNCTVYSFGIGPDTSFDMAAADYGCMVYMMDPTLPPGSYSHLPPKQKFFSVGLWDTSAVFVLNLTQYKEFQGEVNATTEPFDGVQRIIGHRGPVHYLKIDIEGMEWDALKYMMARDYLRKIPQIGVEIHGSSFVKLPADQHTDDLMKKWKLIQQIQAHGFRKISYVPNTAMESVYTNPRTNLSVLTCGELLLLNRPFT